MRKSCVLTGATEFADEFAQACRDYSALHIAVAWTGNPKQTLPYKHLEQFAGRIVATVGTSFNHTHPDGIDWFRDVGADIRIFHNNTDLFHPKVYLFLDGNDYALFVGSSNFTYGWFYSNAETNVLIEGTLSGGKGKDIGRLRDRLGRWHSPSCSFKPSDKWLEQYRQEYANTVRAGLKHRIPMPSIREDEIGSVSWLRKADWNIYYKKVLDGLEQRDEEMECHDLLDEARRLVPLPWKTSYFDDIEKRRIIGGIGDYGWLGHIAASGHVRHLLANGTQREKGIITRCINQIAKFEPPLPWKRLESNLNELVALGSSMKVWGRLLSLVRPELYCTVSSISVRTNLAATLKVSQGRFVLPKGYIQLIQLIHSSPWFNSEKPTQKDEVALWRRRVAFMDVIFY